MATIAQQLFGSGSDSSSAVAEAAEAREESKQAAAVSNDRQLALANKEAERTAVSRKTPRGSRLFSSDESKGGKATKLSG